MNPLCFIVLLIEDFQFIIESAKYISNTWITWGFFFLFRRKNNNIRIHTLGWSL